MLDFIIALDRDIIRFINTNLSDSFTQTVADVFTWLGYGGAVWIIILGIMVLRKRSLRLFILCGVTLLLTFLLSEVFLKLFFQRPRPFVEMPDITVVALRLSSFSFPSGHAAVGAAAFLLFAKNTKNRLAKAGFFILSILVAVSRVFLKVHYPSDVIIGYLLGILIAVACGLVFNRVNFLPRRHNDTKDRNRNQ